jgi:two-component system NarL family sensor kinase
MRLLTHPVAQFAAALVVAFLLVATMTSRLSASAAQREAIADARSVTEVLGQGVVEPALNRGLAYGDPGAVDRFDRVIQERLRVDTLKRLKLWSTDGTIVYSDEPRLVGRRFPLGEDEREVLEHGGSDAELSDLTRPENAFEAGSGDVVEVYTRVTSPEGDPLLFEAYFTLADVNTRKAQIARSFRPVTLAGTLVLTLLATPLAWWLTRRLRRDATAREALLRAAAEASDAERRRIARDLHDGVVQDLAGAAFALSASARSQAPDREALDQISGTVRGSLRSLRSLLVEIYPPDLHETGLRGALDDLLAPAQAAGIETVLEVEDVPDLAPTTSALVWRVAQEAVRNAVRHGRPQHLSVTLSRESGRVRLVVEDDGSGFDPARHPDAERFGLRGMRDLIREAGGSVEVVSAQGEGTRVQLEVDG